MQQQMKAVVFESGGTPRDVLRVREVEVPLLSSGEVLVKVDARPIQPADFMFIGDRYRIKPKFPQVAGLEGGGLIVATGPDTTVAVGRRVAFRYPGSWAEYTKVPEDRLYLVPDGVAPETAAQFSLNPITAYGLLDELDVRPGDCIAINAATSAVALIAADLARRRGVRVVGIVRPGNSTPLPFPKVTSDADDIAAAALAANGGQQFAGLLDSIGGLAIKNMLPAMRQGATIVSFGVLEQTPVQLLNADMIYRNLRWKGFGVDFWLAETLDRHSAIADELWKTILDPVTPLPLPVRSVHSLDDVLTAIADVARGGAVGKVVLTG